MKYSPIITSCVTASFVLLVGCATNPTGLNERREDPSLAISYEEASAEQIAKEAADLGQVIAVSAGSLGKTTATSTSELELNLSGQAWSYENGWWTREGEFSLTGAQGEALTLNGYDSAQFKDETGATVQYPVVMNATSVALAHMGYFHIRNSLGGYIDMGRTYALSGELNRGITDTTLTLEGTLSQSFKAENADKTAWCNYEGTAEVDAVTYEKTADGWSKPVSGAIKVSSPYRDIEITFSNGTAQIIVSDKNGQVKHSTTVTL